MSDVAADTPFSASAARRHLRAHVQVGLVAEMREQSAGLQLADFADRLLSLADEAASVRVFAKQTLNGKLMLQAVQQERDALVALLSRLGIDSEASAEMYRDAARLARVVREVLLVTSPAVSLLVASRLRSEEGGEEMAAVFEQIARRASVDVGRSEVERQQARDRS